MSPRTLRILVIAVVVLFAAVFLLDRQGDGGGEADELLFPNLEEQLDAVTEVTITGADGEVTIVREGDQWVVPAKGGYAANTGTLRDLLIAIAEARKIEQKTSNSEYYDRLGVQAPEEEGSTGTLVEAAGPDGAAFSLILGDPAQQEYRYARIPDDAPSWLIDRNPDVPDDAAGWLASDIVDIPASRIRSVSITHAAGETIRLHKENEEAANFAIEDIPEGRELSYPSVGNSIAAAIDGLALEDVRPAGEDEGNAEGTSTTTVYTTFDGLQLTLDSTTAEDETWIELRAEAVPVEDARTEAAGETEAAEPAEQDSEQSQEEEPLPSEGPATEEAEAGSPEPTPAEQAETINARVSGWEYRIPEYKANQLTRRWQDLLADSEPETEER